MESLRRRSSSAISSSQGSAARMVRSSPTTWNRANFAGRPGTAPASYSSPMVATLAGTDQIVWFHQPGVVGFDVNDGRRAVVGALEQRRRQQRLPAVPAFRRREQDDLDAVTDFRGRRRRLRGVRHRTERRRLHGEGTLEEQESQAQVFDGDPRFATWPSVSTSDSWRRSISRLANGAGSTPERFGYGQIVANGDQLLIQAEDGRIVLGVATDKGFVETGEIQSVLKQTWNAPALSGDLLVVRNHETLAVYKLPTE